MICMCTYLSACARHEHVGRLFRFFLQPKLLDCFAFDSASLNYFLALLAISRGAHVIIIAGSAGRSCENERNKKDVIFFCKGLHKRACELTHSMSLAVVGGWAKVGA